MNADGRVEYSSQQTSQRINPTRTNPYQLRIHKKSVKCLISILLKLRSLHFTWPTQQPTNQSTNLINQLINQPINQPINEPTNNQPINRTITLSSSIIMVTVSSN